MVVDEDREGEIADDRGTDEELDGTAMVAAAEPASLPIVVSLSRLNSKRQ